MQGKFNDKKLKNTAKECAFLAVFVAMVFAAQLALSFLPGVELVTLLFVCYAFVMGWKRGVFAATVFSLLRQMLFGFFPNVLALYLIYYNLLALSFGLLGKKIKNPVKNLPIIVGAACVGTICFTLIDDIITPLWGAYTVKATQAYFYASLTVVIPQVICTAVSVSCLFLPLWKVFKGARKKL